MPLWMSSGWGLCFGWGSDDLIDLAGDVSLESSESSQGGCSALFGGVFVGVVGGVGVPAGPDDAEPGAGDDAVGVGVAFAAVAGVAVEALGPSWLHPGVVGEGGDCLAGAGVGGPAEVDASGLARGFGDGCGAAFGGGLFGVGDAVEDGPDLGEDLGQVDLADPG
jgi:hypothetical protein